MKKATKWHVHLVKTQISLGIRTKWIAKDSSFLHVDSKDSDQTVLMPFCWFCHALAHLSGYPFYLELCKVVYKF